MHLKSVQRILGLLLVLYSLTMVAPVAVGLYTADGQHLAFARAGLIIFSAGFLIWLPVRAHRRELRLRDGFMVAAAFWVGLSAFGSIPLLLATQPAMGITDAVFETVSGLTTTGATTLVGLDRLPASVLYYRAQLQWLGGGGIIVLAVAILPMLGVGGMQLYRAETPGPLKDTKLTPRITQTAKALWLIYLGITVACGFAYWLAGMSLFDAVCHSLATVSTGGYSPHDASIGYFDSPTIEAIATLFMLAASVNFALHFIAWRRLQPGLYFQDAESRAFLWIVGGLAILVAASLTLTGHSGLAESGRHGAFHVVSVITTTGFTTTGFAGWPGALPLLLILASFVGGCGGSTSGGMKVVRWLLLYAQGSREVKRLIHPNAEIPVRLGTAVVPQRVVDAVWGFCVVYVILFAFMLLLLVSTGMDQVTAFSALAASMNNLGPGLGSVAANFTQVGMVGKWICAAAMLLGRLEVFTLLVLVSPAFWRT